MAKTFIDEYINHTSITETPTSFWKWSAYATISAILKDKFFLPMGDSMLFPNIYVLLLAESGGHRKGPPVKLSEFLVHEVNDTKIISGRASIEAILDELARTETNKKTGKVVRSNAAIIYAEELAAGIVANSDGLKVLTDIYDYKPNTYKHRLRTGPSFDLQRIVLSMMSASNAEMIQDFFSPSEIKGGFLARTFLITPNEFRKANSLLRVDKEKHKASQTRVIEHIVEISKLTGECSIDEDGKVEYESWYKKFREEYLRKKESTGVVARIHTGVLKISMILAANELSTTIKKRHIEEAIEQCLGLIPNYRTFTMEQSKSEIGKAGSLVITELVSAKDYMLTRKALIRTLWQTVEPDLLDKVLLALEQAGMIKQIVTGNEQLFKLTDLCLKTMGMIQDDPPI